MKALTEQQARSCENAKGGRCRCRCGGQFHGANRIAENEARGYYELLCKDDPHKLPPPKNDDVPRHKNEHKIKWDTILCKCGCGTYGLVSYITRKPEYLNDDHHRRALAIRKAQKRAMKKALFQAFGDDQFWNPPPIKTGKPPSTPPRLSRGGEATARGAKPIHPGMVIDLDNGLFKADPEPDRSTKRRAAGLPTKAARLVEGR